MSIEVWPFLISRTRVEDYRLVVVPGFMLGTDMESGLRAMALDHTATSEVDEVRTVDLAEGPVTLVLRLAAATRADLGLSAPGPVSDRVGRPIMLIEGVAIGHPLPPPAVGDIGAAELDRAHAEMVADLRHFWETGRAFRRRESVPFIVESEHWPIPAPPEEGPPVPAPAPDPPRGGRVIMLLAPAAALLAVLAALVLIAVLH